MEKIIDERTVAPNGIVKLRIRVKMIWSGVGSLSEGRMEFMGNVFRSGPYLDGETFGRTDGLSRLVCALQDEVIGIAVLASLHFQGDSGGQEPVERDGVFNRIGLQVSNPLLIGFFVGMG